MRRIMPKRIAVLLTHHFDDKEYAESVHAFRAARHTITNIDTHAGKVVHGQQYRENVTIDKSIDDVSPHDFDALLIPGGNSPSHLRLDERFVNFVRHFANLYKPIFCICSAPLLLIDANVVKGRRLTTQDHVSDDLIQAGAVYLNEAVVNDNNLYISSRSTTDLGAFIHESLNVLKQ